ncbi:MAG: HrcA family transcriptional regulator, partial [Lachnospiraceae bacterium]|nr:HrcA family transcriptional regulator [Lachnospiraceae bacterium]
TNIFKYPELSDSQSASDLLSAFEEKEELRDLFDGGGEDPCTDIQIYIGNESPIQRMRDCSVVTATYELGDGIHGTVGIVGPKRMDYEMVVDNLKTLKRQLDGIFNKKEEQS